MDYISLAEGNLKLLLIATVSFQYIVYCIPAEVEFVADCRVFISPAKAGHGLVEPRAHANKSPNRWRRMQF